MPYVLLRGAGVQLTVEDRRQAGEPIELRFEGGLTPVQEQAVQALLAHDVGVFVAPPGVGKTVVGNTLLVVEEDTGHRQSHSVTLGNRRRARVSPRQMRESLRWRMIERD